jgi:tRNA-Thr(GGU) m(6)t(6)A37 methyltransferase TsaA
MQDRFALRPIGVVRSSMRDTRAMPVNGVPAAVEVYEAFAPALAEIASNTHVWVIAWLHEAAGEAPLQTRGRHARPGGAGRGVFGLRHAARPNPLGLTAARLMGVEGRLIRLDRLDFVDGTPVADLKRYSPIWDSIFAARTYYETLPRDDEAATIAADLFLEAVHFHGEACVGAALAARMLAHVMGAWGVAAKDPALRVCVGRDGCLADGLQAVTGGTLGSGRLQVGRDAGIRFTHGWRRMRLQPRPQLPLQADAVLHAPASALFGVQEEAVADTI